MDANYVFQCGMVWSQFGEHDAGMELITALQSSDPSLRVLARAMLEHGSGSRELLGQALADRIISHSEAELCLFAWETSNAVPRLHARVWFPSTSS